MDNSNDWIKFEKLLKYEKYLLQIFCFRSMKTLFLNQPYVKNIYETLFFLVSLAIMTGIFLINILYVISVWNDDIDSAITTLPILLCQVITISKGIMVWYYGEELYNILDNLHEKWNASFNRTEIRDEILKRVTKITKFRNMYALAYAFLWVTFVYPPFGNIFNYFYQNTNGSLDYSQTMWPTEVYPFRIDTFFRYICISTIEVSQAYIYCVYSAVGDLFYVQIFTHISIQFQVLANDIITTVETNKDGNSKTLSVELKYIVMRHEELYKLIDKMNDELYSSVIFVSFVIGSINICLNLYEVQQGFNKGDYYTATRNLILGVSMSFEVVLYCVQAQVICESAELIPDAIYNSQWLHIDKNSQITFQIILSRCQHKLTCGAYGLVNIDHEQITQVCKRTASFFVFLDSIQEQS